MARYTKIPVTVEAEQWTGENLLDICRLTGRCGGELKGEAGTLKIKTLEGTMTAQPGDYIIKGVDGECYPCKPDIFAKTHCEVGDTYDLARLRELVEADREKGNDDEPLPLENLEYMVGKPVWIAPAKERGRVQSRWMLYAGKVDRPDYTVVHLFNPASGICQGYEASNYGKTWLAYACEQIGAQVVHGRWVPEHHRDKVSPTEFHEYTWYYCSRCGRRLIGYTDPTEAPYCHCGAKMDGKEKTNHDG